MKPMIFRWLAVASLALMYIPGSAMAQEHRLGGGVHYWRTVDDLEESDFDIEESGLSYLASYQYVTSSLFMLEVDLEVFTDDFAGADETIYAPQVFALLGAGIYGGLGIGTFVVDSEYSEDPFYTLRAGIDLEVLPDLHLDVNANYTFTDFDSIETIDEDIDTDTITLGAMIRIAL